MPADDTRLLVTIEARLAQFEKAMAKASATSTRTARQIQSSFSRTESFLQGFGRGALSGLVAQLTAIVGAGAIFRSFIDNTIQAQEVTAQLNAVLKSTGGAAGLTAEQIEEMASKLQSLTSFEDEAIIKAQNLLLTFTKIRGDVFEGATATILDMSQALSQDLSASAIQVGKALQDPVRGITALRRVGVNFSDAQKTVIQNLVETNRLADAQAIILKELQTEFGGSAVAARDTLGGALKSLSNAWGDLFELGAPETRQLQDAIENLITAISDPEFKAFVQLIGTSLVNAIKDAAAAAPALVEQFQNLRQQAENFRAVTTNVFRDALPIAAARKGADVIQETLGFTDDNLQRIDAAHESLQEVANDIKLYDALRRKAAEAGGDFIAGGAGPVLNVVDPAALEEEAAALEAEAAAIEAAKKAAEDAERSRKRAADEIQRQRDAVVELISDLEFENSLIGLTNAERETEIALRRAGTEATAEQRAEIARLVETGESEREALDRLVERMDALRDTAGNALSSFMDELRDGASLADGLSAALDRVLDSVLGIIQQQLITSLFGALGTAGGGVLGNQAGALFGGARAEGGPVSPRKAYRVGERGPEIFVPRTAGNIIPNGGGARTEMHFHNAPPVIERTETRDSRGNSRQDITFETAMIGASQNPRTRRAMGLSQPLVRR